MVATATRSPSASVTRISYVESGFPERSARASPRKGPSRLERINEMEVWAFVQYRPSALESAANATSARTKMAPSCTVPMPLSWHPCVGIPTRLYPLPTSSTSMPSEGSCRRKCARISSSVNILPPCNNLSASPGRLAPAIGQFSILAPTLSTARPFSFRYRNVTDKTKRSRPPGLAQGKATSA